MIGSGKGKQTLITSMLDHSLIHRRFRHSSAISQLFLTSHLSLLTIRATTFRRRFLLHKTNSFYFIYKDFQRLFYFSYQTPLASSISLIRQEITESESLRRFKYPLNDGEQSEHLFNFLFC